MILRFFRVFGVLLMIRHGQSGDPCLQGEGGVYKTVVFVGFTAILSDWVHSATAIWVLHFGVGKHQNSTKPVYGNTPS